LRFDVVASKNQHKMGYLDDLTPDFAKNGDVKWKRPAIKRWKPSGGASNIIDDEMTTPKEWTPSDGDGDGNGNDSGLSDNLSNQYWEYKQLVAEDEAKRIAAEMAKQEKPAAIEKAEEARITAKRKAEEAVIAAAKAEEERVAAERKAEKERSERIAAAKKAEKERIAAEKNAQQEKLAEKKAEAERVAAERRAREQHAVARIAERERLAAKKKEKEARIAAGEKIPASLAMVPINKESVELTAGVLGGTIGLAIGGPLAGLIFALATNYVSRGNSPLSEAFQNYSRATIETYNNLARLDAKFQLLQRTRESLNKVYVQVLKSEGVHSVSAWRLKKSISEITEKIDDVNKEYDIVGAGLLAMRVLGDVVEIGLNKMGEMNGMYKLSDKAVGSITTAVDEDQKTKNNNSST